VNKSIKFELSCTTLKVVFFIYTGVSINLEPIVSIIINAKSNEITSKTKLKTSLYIIMKKSFNRLLCYHNNYNIIITACRFVNEIRHDLFRILYAVHH